MATMEMIRPEAAKKIDTTLRTILVHIQDGESAIDRVETGLTIARAASAHLSCLRVTPIEAYVAFDGFGGVFVMNDIMRTLDEEDVRIRRLVEDELRREDVAWDYRQATGNVAVEIVAHAVLADLVVTSRMPAKDGLGRPAISLFGDLLQNMRTPLFIAGSAPVDLTGPALIAWNGSIEAANAVRSSLGLLKLASSIEVLQVLPASSSSTFPGTLLLEYLSRQGLHAELTEQFLESADDELVAAGIRQRARAIGGATVLMGAYGHSRIREYLFGGVTRALLRDCDAPLVLGR